MNIRETIIAELDRRRWSRYKLAEAAQKKGVAKASVYEFLAGKHAITSDAVCVLFEILEIKKK